MGAAGPLPKPPEERDARNTYRPAEVLPTGGLAVTPNPPVGLRGDARQEWDAFWASDMRRFVSEIDVPLIRRLFLLRDMWNRITKEIRKFDASQQGDKDVVALQQSANRYAAQMLAIEKPLGIGPANRARMNLKPDPTRAAQAAPAASSDDGPTDGSALEI